MQTETQHNTFDDVNHLPLRVFNRVMFMSNLAATVSPEEAKAYGASFNEGEREQLYVMGAYIKAKGLDEARKTVTKGLQLVN